MRKMERQSEDAEEDKEDQENMPEEVECGAGDGGGEKEEGSGRR